MILLVFTYRTGSGVRPSQSIGVTVTLYETRHVVRELYLTAPPSNLLLGLNMQPSSTAKRFTLKDKQKLLANLDIEGTFDAFWTQHDLTPYSRTQDKAARSVAVGRD